ncbi:elongin A, like [Pempheris klunzingeri]|uniref:elongin A, like n=1 Tax=Pempheris klunzingeri TaxID=3127111 RepID=UPI00397FC004
MASSSDVAKRVMRCKLQLTDAAEPATVLKILQKLKDLDITLDVLAETGIGKAVNSMRRHEQAGELAKSLVRGWKRLIPKESTSHSDDRDTSENLSIKDKVDVQNCPNNGSLMMEDLNNNCLTSHDKSQDCSDEALFKTGKRKAVSEKQCEEQKRHKGQSENQTRSQQQNENISQNDVWKEKTEIQEDIMNTSAASKRRRADGSRRKSGDEDTSPANPEDAHEKSRSESKSHSDSRRFGSEKESNKKSKTSKEASKEDGDSFALGSSEKYLKLAKVEGDRSPGIPRSSEAQSEKKKKASKEKYTALKHQQDSDDEEHSREKNKKDKMRRKDVRGDPAEPSMSFESYLNYDVNVVKRKERPGVKKKMKNVVKEATKHPGVKVFKPPVTSLNVSPPKQLKESVMDLINIPLPALLPECEMSSVEYFERRAEKENEVCDASEESAGFTGQRLNKKMQVYSGAKTIFLPAMMSLHQQCIRTLQNNINLLYETGGVPFDILEPVLERCTPEQLLRIEECNPIYIGVTDHLWGRHCQRDFKDSKLQEYESWKEMYVRLSEERERKFKRLTKSIVSAHSQKPRGRQVKMAFIHTVAKPPRDVRIQQEIHGTAVQQPHQPRCSVKVQDGRSRPSCNEPSRSNNSSSSSSSNSSNSSNSSSGAVNTQDPRKKTRVAPMMAKSLKALKKQLGRR